MIVFARVLLAALLLYVGDPGARRRGPRGAAAACAATRGARSMQGTLAVAIPFSLISFGETQISLRAHRRADLARAAVRRAARAADRPDREGRPPRRRSALRDRLRRRGPADRRRHGRTASASSSARWRCSAPRSPTGWARCTRGCKFRGRAAAGGELRRLRASPRVLTLPPALATLGENSPDAGRDRGRREPRRDRHRGRVRPLLRPDRRGRRRPAALCGYLIPPLALAYGACCSTRRSRRRRSPAWC